MKNINRWNSPANAGCAAIHNGKTTAAVKARRSRTPAMLFFLHRWKKRARTPKEKANSIPVGVEQVLNWVKAMVELCRHKEELRQGAFIPFMKSVDCGQPKKVRQKKIDYGEWLQADLPALHLCHSERRWAKVLKEIVHT